MIKEQVEIVEIEGVIMNELIVYQGTKEYFGNDLSFNKKNEALKEKLREFFNLKNVNFLFGSGTSSGAIPTMQDLFEKLEFAQDEKELKKVFRCINRKVGDNLEKCLSVMYAARSYYNGIKSKGADDQKFIDYNKELYEKLIKKVEHHIFKEINIGFDSEEAQQVLEFYKTFYQKLALRSKDNSRIRVFTTNNDLFNETALDALNLHYINGFGGGLRKFFNPALFNYTWSKRMDTSIDKYEPAEDMVYLYKIHGSVNWRETEKLENNYFEIEEVSPALCTEKDAVLVYPTPTKQDKSLGSPYVDLFREFQHKLLDKAFLFGMFSGAVEPVAAVLGLFLAMQIQAIMPWALAFAAGCMIYVVAEEMIPEMKGEEHNHFGVWSFIIGFIVMMVLDCL